MYRTGITSRHLPLPHIGQYRYANKRSNTVHFSTQIYRGNKSHKSTTKRKSIYCLEKNNLKIDNRLSWTCNYSSSSDPPHDKQTPQKTPQSSSQQKAYEYVNSSRAQMIKFMHLVKEQSQNPAVQEFGNRLTEKTSYVMKRGQDRLRAFGAVSAKPSDNHPEDWNDMLNRWVQKYQDFVGITDLKKAQERVTELTVKLQSLQSSRQNFQLELETSQENLLVNQQRITKTELYSEEHYALFEEARDINSKLKVVRKDFDRTERDERETFEQLSTSIRDCHERERTQAEQSKYWSIIASIVSAAIASVITSFNNWVRIREIKEHVTRSGKQLSDNFESLQDKLLQTVGNSLIRPTAIRSAAVVGSIPAATIHNEIKHVVKEEPKAAKEEIKTPSPAVTQEDTKPTSKDTVLQHVIFPDDIEVSISKEDMNHLQEIVRQTVAHEVAVLAHSHSLQSHQPPVPPIEVKDLNLSTEDLDRIQTLVKNSLEGIKLEVISCLVQEKRDLLHELQQEVSTSISQEKQVLHEDFKEITTSIAQERDNILKELKDMSNIAEERDSILKELKDVSNSIIQERQAIFDKIQEDVSLYTHEKLATMDEKLATMAADTESITSKEPLETKTEDVVLVESVGLAEKKMSKDARMKEADVILEESDLMSVESAALSSEHSFPSILTAMAIGAGIGTLITAAVLGGSDGP